MSAIANRTQIKQYTICHKGTFNTAFSKCWGVYPSAWINAKRWGISNIPENWRELYDVVCKTYSIENVEIVTK